MKKIALVYICLNKHYWPFLKDVIEDAKKHFLPNHQVDFFAWSDMPELDSPEYKAILDNSPSQKEINEFYDFFNLYQFSQQLPSNFGSDIRKQLDSIPAPKDLHTINMLVSKEKVKENVEFLRTEPRLKVFHIDSIEWPYPTLLRYDLFLQQEEILKEYDYIFYMDADMRIVDTIGEEILGQGLTMAEHPMYAVDRKFIPPYEPNRESTAYIPRFGVVVKDSSGNPWFKPLYAAGGFQGGTSETFIEAMKQMKSNIEKDFNNNYIAIWNDESHWNKYLFDYFQNKGHLTVLTPAYVYPDSMIEGYYAPIWGTNYSPKIITLTKKFSTSKEGAGQANKMVKDLSKLK